MNAARFPWLLGLCAVLGLLLGWANGGLSRQNADFGEGFAPQVPVAPPDPQPANAIAAYDVMWRGVGVAAPQAPMQAAAPQWRLAGVVNGRAMFVSPEAGGARLVAEGETAPDGRTVVRVGEASVSFEGDEQETRLYVGPGGEGQ